MNLRERYAERVEATSPPRATPRGADSERPAEDTPPRAPGSFWYAYILECGDGTLYAGATTDVVRRVEAHGAGASKYTRARGPFRVVWKFGPVTQSEALAEERRVKRLTRAEKVALVEADGCARLTATARRRVRR